ncbi:MAG: HigA family addiction module antidote protein [Gammaproteobacteria bacterium]|jgi:addiction module HigA family antidote|nr:HigA family addiction module antidote protein [Gammaproteobacteria bacterium]
MPIQHPGQVLLQQYLQAQNISQNALARAIKVPPRRINEIVHEKRSITADTAVRLAIYFGDSASYWMHLQAEFEIEKIKNKINIQLSSIQAPLSIEHPQTDNKDKTKQIKPKPNNSVKKRIMR